VETLTSFADKLTKNFLNNGRNYRIYVNMGINATNLDILKSYYFTRLLDLELQEEAKTAKVEFTKQQIDSAVERAEA